MSTHLEDVCAEMKNYFIRGEDDIHFGTFTVSGGTISPVPFLQNGQYYRIVGSVFNDGVWRYPDETLKDEVFIGAVWAMTVPPAVVALSEDILNWNLEHATVLNSPYQSESFGGYSYTKAGAGTSGDGFGGGVLTWQKQFRDRLNRWRRVSVL